MMAVIATGMWLGGGGWGGGAGDRRVVGVPGGRGGCGAVGSMARLLPRWSTVRTTTVDGDWLSMVVLSMRICGRGL